MAELSILLFGEESALLRLVRDDDSVLGAREFHVVRDLDDACVFVRQGVCDLVVIDASHSVDPNELSHLLDVCALMDWPLPVVALSDEYRVDVALELFRLGVSDYLALTEHGENLAQLLGMLCASPQSVPPRVERQSNRGPQVAAPVVSV